MADCCHIGADIPERQRRVLRIVLAINLALFGVELGAGLLAHSTALLADAMDMLGDAFVYAFSLYVVARGVLWQARAAIVKGAMMAAFGAGLLAEVARKLAVGAVPASAVMGAVGGLALAANVTCLALLWRRRADDVNLRSAWLCSRNDVIGNLGVLLAAVGVNLAGSAWPDILVGLAIAALYGRSAVGVIRAGRRELRVGRAAPPAAWPVREPPTRESAEGTRGRPGPVAAARDHGRP
jgi:Co/Zn/Cd efflux system component